MLESRVRGLSLVILDSDIEDIQNLTDEVLGAFIGRHAHLMANLLNCCVNKTVRRAVQAYSGHKQRSRWKSELYH
jgi:hypothetical protein